MQKFLKENEKQVSVAIISFACGFAGAFLLIQLYTNREVVGTYCARTAVQAQEYFNNLKIK
jgi:hypothetical protein